MPNYVEENYSENYVEGDTLPSTVANCDLTAVNAELALIKQQNIDLNAKLDAILAKVNSTNTISLTLADKANTIDTKLDNVPTETLDISNLATQDFIINKIPLVDDSSLVVYPKGTEVLTAISNGVFIVESSKFVPTDRHTFTVVYTLSKIVNGEKAFSDFHSSYVVEKEADAYMLVSDCPSYGA